jgi:hypothetical protein
VDFNVQKEKEINEMGNRNKGKERLMQSEKEGRKEGRKENGRFQIADGVQ